MSSPGNDVEPGGSSLASDLRKVARNSYLKIASGVVSGIGKLALTVVVTRAFGASGAGAFFSGLAVFTLASLASELGADTGFVRTISRFRTLGRVGDIRRTLVIGLVPVFLLSSALAVALMVFASPLTRAIAGGAGSGQVVMYIRTLAPFLPFAVLSTVTLSGSIGFGTVVPSVLVDNVGKPAVRPVLALIVVGLGLGPVALALSWALPIVGGLAVGMAFLISLTRKAEDLDTIGGVSRAEPPPSSYRKLGAEFWSFSAPRAFASVLEALLVRVDILLVGGLATTTLAGVYAASSRMLGLGGFALGAVILAISPQISAALAVQDHDRDRGLYQTCTSWLMIPSWPIFFLLAIFAPLILRILGTQFEQGRLVLTMLSLSMLVSMATGPVTSVLLMGGFSVWNLVNSALGVGATVGLNVWLVPRFGLTGAAVAGSVSIIGVQVAAALEVWALLGLAPLGRGSAVVALASVCCVAIPSLILRLLLGPTLLSLVLSLIVSVPAYFLILRRYQTALRFSLLREALRRRRAGSGDLVEEVPAGGGVRER